MRRDPMRGYRSPQMRKRDRRRKRILVAFCLLTPPLLAYLFGGSDPDHQLVQAVGRPTKTDLAVEAKQVTADNISKLKEEIAQLEKEPKTPANISDLRACRITLQRQEALNKLARDEKEYQAYYRQKH